MKLVVGKIYKVNYTDSCGNSEVFYGEYVGIEEDKYSSIPCVICQAENHRRGHQFNSYYTTILGNEDYETFHIGTSCITKCQITESDWETMINN